METISKRHAALLCLALGLGGAGAARAAVTDAEAAQLKGELTPMGSEKAGNKEGTIPAWDGGYTKLSPGYKSGDPRPDPFAAEKPLLTIDAKNVDQHADKLTDGVKALIKKYPTYRVDVYPTHRTAVMPPWAYDNTLKNATRCKTKDGGTSLESCYGGIPFPIPKTGHELMWNHLLSWRGQAHTIAYRSYIVPNDGQLTLVSQGIDDQQFPYWFKDIQAGATPETFKGDTWQSLLTMSGPPFKAGESFILRDPVEFGSKGRQAWQYLVGQRRVRKAPTIGYDAPDNVNSGFLYFDEAFSFNGGLDRFDWKIVGKKEMYIPYNGNRFWLAEPEKLMGPKHHNPDYWRWELHRVWIVEATVAPGKRQAVPKRRFYVDEDTWTAVLYDGWDAQGQLWRMGWMMPIVSPDVPGTISRTFGIYNLLAGTYQTGNLPAGLPFQFRQVEPRPDSYFTPDNLAAKGTR